MQDKISVIENSLLKLLEMSKELELEVFNDEFVHFTSLLEALFSEDYIFEEYDLQRLSAIQIKYIKLCSQIASEKENVKQSILTVVKNKKNVGAYNQHK